jgi:hypothetical protein
MKICGMKLIPNRALMQLPAFDKENLHRQVGGIRVGRAKVVKYLSRMTTPRDPLYVSYRYPAEFISFAV